MKSFARTQPLVLAILAASVLISSAQVAKPASNTGSGATVQRPTRAKASTRAKPKTISSSTATTSTTSSTTTTKTKTAGKPVTARAGKPVTARAGKPVTAKAGKPVTARAGKTTTARAGKTVTEDPVAKEWNCTAMDEKRIKTSITMKTSYMNGSPADNNFTKNDNDTVKTTVKCSIEFTNSKVKDAFAPYLYHIWLYSSNYEQRIAVFHPQEDAQYPKDWQSPRTGVGRVFADHPDALKCGFFNNTPCDMTIPLNDPRGPRVYATAEPATKQIADKYTLTVTFKLPTCCEHATFRCWYFIWTHPCFGGFNGTEERTLVTPCNGAQVNYLNLLCDPDTERLAKYLIMQEECKKQPARGAPSCQDFLAKTTTTKAP